MQRDDAVQFRCPDEGGFLGSRTSDMTAQSIIYRNRLAKRLALCAVVVLCAALEHDLTAQTPPRQAVALAILGSATYGNPGDASLPLKPGDNLAEGLELKTGPNSAVDLSLGKATGVLRLTEGTTVVLEKLIAGENTPEDEIHIRVSLKEGTVLGLGNRLSTVARYEVKTPTAILAVGGSEFRIDARGPVVLLAGKLLLAHAPPGGQPTAHTLQAPPAVFFSPMAGVQRAPSALVREVRAQCKPKLRAR